MQNSSGFQPLEFNVVVKPDPVEEKTKGGLVLPDEVKERDRYGATRATIVAVSPMAFSSEVWPKDEPRPEPGMRCLMARHAGVFVTGEDDEDYRIIKDTDMVALIDSVDVEKAIETIVGVLSGLDGVSLIPDQGGTAA